LGSGGLVSEQVESGEAKIVFEAAHDVERWDVRGRRGDISVEYFNYTTPEVDDDTVAETTTSSGGIDERFVMLSVERDGATLVVDGRWTFRDQDRVAIALHLPERDDALRALAEGGWALDPSAGDEPQATDDPRDPPDGVET
jgi:hypothetical protein